MIDPPWFGRSFPILIIRIYTDTDIMTDVDDVGALAVANVLNNCGLAELRGVVVNTHSHYGALAASVGISRHILYHMRRETQVLRRSSIPTSATATSLSPP